MPPRRAKPQQSSASPHDAAAVEKFVQRLPELAHLRARRRAALITIESGPEDDPVPHARLRRVSSNCWRLEMPTFSGRWEPTPFEGGLEDVLSMLVADFGWTLQRVV